MVVVIVLGFRCLFWVVFCRVVVLCGVFWGVLCSLFLLMFPLFVMESQSFKSEDFAPLLICFSLRKQSCGRLGIGDTSLGISDT